MKKPVIIISGIDANTANPAPGTPVAESIKYGMDCQIVGLAYSAYETGIFDSTFNSTYILPYPSDEIQTYKNALFRIFDEVKPDIYIPCLDVEIPVVNYFIDEIEARGIKTLFPTKNQFDSVSKKNVYNICCEAGVESPFSKIVSDINALVKIEKDISYPMVLKGPYYGAVVVYNLAHAVAEYNRIISIWGSPITAQKIVKDSVEIDLCAIGDGLGGFINPLAIRKMHLLAQGKVGIGVTVHNDEILEIAKKVFAHTKWRGPLELEFLIDKHHKPLLIEVNPRFPAWIEFSSKIEYNLPLSLVQMLLGQQCVIAKQYDAGKMLIKRTTNIVSDITAFTKIGNIFNDKQ